jgi:CHAT domain-containing protein/Tfp pilus assembly protein PilF
MPGAAGTTSPLGIPNTPTTVLLRLPAVPTASAVPFQPMIQGVTQGRMLSIELPCHEMAYSLRQRIATCQSFLAMQQQSGDRAGAGATLNNLGLVYQEQGKYADAAQVYQQALMLHQQLDLPDRQSATLTNLGSIHQELGQYAQALEFYQQALALYKTTNNRDYIGRTLNNLGTLHRQLGQDEAALASYQQALTIAQEANDRPNAGTVLHNIGLLHNKAKRYTQALEMYQQALVMRQELGDRSGEGLTLNNIGLLHNALGESTEAISALKTAQVIFQTLGNTASLGNVLDSQGTVYKTLKQPNQAIIAYQQALALAQSSGAKALEAEILANIGELFAEQRQPKLAIAFYKRSVQTTETIRQTLRTLPYEQQDSYIQTVATTYRALADLLLKQDRVLEAQQILDLLKVQELKDYLRTVRGTVQPVEFLKPETEILQKFEARQQTAIQLGQELSQLRQIPEPQRTTQQTLNIQFSQFINSADVQALLNQLKPSTLRQTVDLADLNQLRDELRQVKAVLLYPLILDDRLELVITTPNSPPLRRTVKVTKAELNQTILEFRQALVNSSRTANTKQLGQKLYSWLIQPLEKDLQQSTVVGGKMASPVETIIYAPDGQLRYIPLSALHDGNQWLVQRYRVNNITAKSLMGNRFVAQPATRPRILAGAILGQETAYPIKTRGITLQGLTYAKAEVNAIATTLPNATTQLLGNDFSVQATKTKMNDYSILHFATHAAFVSGDPSQSFILFGDSSIATLQEIQAGWSLKSDLVVLSACETGLGGKLGNGEEILGLGYVFQERGAKATVASLWSVQDDSTAVLMNGFYAHLQKGLSKAEALRQAQLSLINSGNYDRPLHWAPFILIGNGL